VDEPHEKRKSLKRISLLPNQVVDSNWFSSSAGFDYRIKMQPVIERGKLPAVIAYPSCASENNCFNKKPRI
jgi:hypothetical protein